MKIAVLGAGKQARGVVEYLYRTFWFNQTGVKPSVTVVDADPEAAEAFKGLYPQMHLTAFGADVGDIDKARSLLKEHDVAISCVPYFLNETITRAAILGQCHLCDLGGNNDVVDAQRELSDQAKEAGVTIIPDCGLAPGMVSILASDAINDGYDDIDIMVGGLPVNSETGGVLQYGRFFSLEGLVNEYVEPVKVLVRGKPMTLQPLSDYDRVEVAGKQLEAFATSGGISTLPDSFKGQKVSIRYRTLRYPGHHRVIKALHNLKQLTAANIDALLTLDRIPSNNAGLEYATLDKVFIKVVATKHQGRDRWVRTYESVIHSDTAYNGGSSISAMMKATAYSAAIIALMLPDLSRGVQVQENIVHPDKFLAAWRAASLPMWIKETKNSY